MAELETSAPVRELLSPAQLAVVERQAGSGAAPCIHCGEAIDPDRSAVAVVMLVDPVRQRAAVRLAHAACGGSEILHAEITSELDSADTAGGAGDPNGPAAT